MLHKTGIFNLLNNEAVEIEINIVFIFLKENKYLNKEIIFNACKVLWNKKLNDKNENIKLKFNRENL